jgi:hypothetical protein
MDIETRGYKKTNDSRDTAGHTRNDDISGLTVGPIEKKLAEYKQKSLNYVSRIKDIKFTSLTIDLSEEEEEEEKENEYTMWQPWFEWVHVCNTQKRMAMRHTKSQGMHL